MTDSPRQPWPADARQLRIGDLQFDLRYRRVIRPDQEIELPQRMFELLLVLLAQPHALHTRADLFRRVWAGVIVEDANLSQSIWMLRKALGPERKHWIRTVSKSGYVFEPPGPVEVVPDPTANVVALVTASPKSEAAPTPASAKRSIVSAATRIAIPPPAPRARRWRHWAAAGAATGLVAVAVLIAGGGALRSRADVAAPVAAPLNVVLIELQDRTVGAELRWPSKLLHAWLEWKLSSLPEVTLLTEAHLAADAPASSPRIVLLVSGRSAVDPDEVFLRARFDEAGSEHQIELRGATADVPAMVDALSRRVMERLLPARANDRWPALTVDASSARRYVDAFVAYQQRDWLASITAAREVTQRAPGFGLARLHLALALARLGQAAPAVEQMAAARASLKPLPEGADAVSRALQWSIDPRHYAQAAIAYGELAQEYPGQTAFVLEQARLLGQSDQWNQARAILSRPTWDGQPAGVQIGRLLNLATVDLSLGDPERARASARKAERLARAAGQGWALERGRALLLLAQADAFQHPDRTDTSPFELAAIQFESAGDRINALYARFLAETARPPNGASASLDALLAQARAGGYYRIEVDILRRVAFQHFFAGDQAQYRKRLEQALATAQAAGDLVGQQLLDLDLLNEDVLRGDFASADRRIHRLRNAGLQGDSALWVDQFEAGIASARGQYAQALAALDRSTPTAATGAAAPPPLSVARVACARADVLLLQGDLANARAQWTRCGAPDQPFTRLQTTLGRATTDLFAGDRKSALARLHEGQSTAKGMPHGPDRWMVSLQIAALLTRLGDLDGAERLYAYVLPEAHQAGYALLVAHAETGLAEVAAARGDWSTSRRHAAIARRQPSADAWALANRLDVVAIAAALAGGDRGLATSLLADVDHQAHRLGDAVAQVEVHSLMSTHAPIAGCGSSARTTLVAKTGLRGATLDWLVQPLAIADLSLPQHRVGSR